MFRRQTPSLRRQSRSIRPVTRSPQLTRRCLFEQLEDRRLLACEVFVNERTLFVRGDEGDNQISVGQRNDQMIVTCDGSFTRKPSGDIDAVQVKGGDGNDSLNVARVDPTLNVFGDAGNDSIHVIIDVNDDGPVTPTDPLFGGGGGHDTIQIDTSLLAELVKIVGTGDRVVLDPDISVANRATGAMMAQFHVQETEGITVNTHGGDDQVELEDPRGLFAGLGLAINTGEGADDVRYLVGVDPSDPSLPNAPQHLLVNLGSTPGPNDNPVFLAEDHFLLDATAGWCPSDPSIPAMIDVLGGRGTQEVTLKFGQIGEPIPGNQQPGVGLMIHLALGAGDDSANTFYGTGVYRPVAVRADMGGGNDQFSQVLQKVRVGAGFALKLDGGGGDDRAALEVHEAACPSDPSLPPGPCQPIDIDIATGGGMDTVEATIQDLGIDLHLDAILGGGDDEFTATVMPDTAVGPGGGCIEANVHGGGGRDTLTMNVGDNNVDPNNPNAPRGRLAAELMLNFDGGGGGDAFLIGMLNVAIDGPVTIVEVGGAGNDSFHDTFSQVAAGGGAWNIAHQGGAGNDSFHSSFSDVFADLSIGANLGSGNDTAVIAIIRKAATASLSSSAAPSELVPAVRVEVAAGAGHDDVTLAIDRAIEDFSAFLDGGKGRDFDHVTENVKAKGHIVNFEKEEVLPYIEQAPNP